MSTSQEKVWDEIAKHWNDFREVPSPSVVGFLKDKKGRILDLGCGSGRNFSAMAHAGVSPDGQKKDVKLFAVDFSKEMLNYSEKKAVKMKLNAVFEKAETDKLPFEDDFFDATICAAVLHCIETKKKRQKTIKEIYRTLKPGCEAFISSWGRNSPRLKNKPKECFVPWSVKSDKQFREDEGKIKQERYTYIYDLEELKKEVLDAGFKIERAWEERNVNVIVRK